jgi:hypothetical protein
VTDLNGNTFSPPMPLPLIRLSIYFHQQLKFTSRWLVNLDRIQYPNKRQDKQDLKPKPKNTALQLKKTFKIFVKVIVASLRGNQSRRKREVHS